MAKRIVQALLVSASAVEALIITPAQSNAAAAACPTPPTVDGFYGYQGTVKSSTPLRTGPASTCSGRYISGAVAVSCWYANSAGNIWYATMHYGTLQDGWVYGGNFTELNMTLNDENYCDGW
ncbi:hypothetical protein [Streptomyces sp. Ncost-T10-10d]|uniref:hypothetical protein n=1 Tax=Streptomyces sp. Ncost-T10-10d TaxID=1839774 RepID=UPI00081F6AAB|nr:hypothetical protein [Streptomyces sp. Ncost-T10-10d]SCF72711.1 hypothetical protein GA0115254_113610 [Streptomyces sp. Ncost-T10-10d]